LPLFVSCVLAEDGVMTFSVPAPIAYNEAIGDYNEIIVTIPEGKTFTGIPTAVTYDAKVGGLGLDVTSWASDETGKDVLTLTFAKDGTKKDDGVSNPTIPLGATFKVTVTGPIGYGQKPAENVGIAISGRVKTADIVAKFAGVNAGPVPAEDGVMTFSVPAPIASNKRIGSREQIKVTMPKGTFTGIPTAVTYDAKVGGVGLYVSSLVPGAKNGTDLVTLTFADDGTEKDVGVSNAAIPLGATFKVTLTGPNGDSKAAAENVDVAITISGRVEPTNLVAKFAGVNAGPVPAEDGVMTFSVPERKTLSQWIGSTHQIKVTMPKGTFTGIPTAVTYDAKVGGLALYVSSLVPDAKTGDDLVTLTFADDGTKKKGDVKNALIPYRSTFKVTLTGPNGNSKKAAENVGVTITIPSRIDEATELEATFAGVGKQDGGNLRALNAN